MRKPLLLLVAFAVLAYVRVLGNGFVALDDPLLITENPIVRTFSMQNVAQAFTSFDPELYVPLTVLTYQLEYAFAGAEPALYHLTNLLLHVASVLLLFLLFARLIGKQDIALAVSVLFALHPINVETVAWAAARKDLLSGVCFLCAWLSYLHWRQDGGRRLYVVSLMVFALGLLSKVTILGLPIVLLVMEWMRGKKLDWKPLLPFFALSFFFLFIAVIGKADAWGIENVPLADRLSQMLIGLVFPLFKILWPLQLSVVYPLQDISLPAVAIAACVTAAGLALIHRRTAVLALTLYTVTLLPSLVNLTKAGETYAGSDRYAYLAAIGVFLVAVLALERFAKTRQTFIAVTGIIAASCALMTISQVAVWANTETLFAHALRIAPSSSVAHLSLGGVCLERRETACAIAEYQQAIAVLPGAKQHTALASAYLEAGDVEKAEAAYQRALEIDPDYGNAYAGLGAIAGRRDDAAAQIAHLEKAVALTSDRISFRQRVLMYNDLAVAYAKQGKHEQEMAQYRAAIELDPLFAPAYYNLAVALREQGKSEEADAMMREALRLQPELEGL